MENRPIGPEEQDDTNDSASTKKKRGSTLSRYLSALRGKEASTDDSQESNTEKPKRVQKLFKRLFPGIVERPAHLSADEKNDQEYEFNQEAWFGWVKHAKQHESANAASGKAENIVAAESLPVDTPKAVEVSAQGFEEPVEQTAVQQTTVETGQVSSPDIADVPAREEPSVSDAVRREREVFSEDAVVPPTARPGEIPLRSTREVETIIERRGSNLLPVALVGAEYLGRKRADKKLEARVDRKIDAGNEKQQRSEALQKELEQIVSQNKQHIEQLKQARAHTERQAPRSAETKEAAAVIVPSVEIRVAAQPEKRVTVEKTSFGESIQPKNIAEKVADAAEHDMPVERAFERSHEVKDDIPVTTGAAASVGAVIAASATASGISPVHQSTARSNVHADKNLPFMSDADNAALYRQAAKMGFWSAICVIVLGSIAYLMVRYI